MGGSGDSVRPGSAEYAAEYNVAFATQEQISAAFRGVAAACAGAGRSADSMRWSVAQTVCCGRDEAEVSRRADAIGRNPAELREFGLGGTRTSSSSESVSSPTSARPPSTCSCSTSTTSTSWHCSRTGPASDRVTSEDREQRLRE